MTDTFTRTEADMAEAWQTLEEAALTLGISSRTLHRRLARGEFQTRMESGRREVLVVIEERDPSLDRLAAAGRFAASASASLPTSDASDTSATPEDEATYTSDNGDSPLDETADDDVQQTMLALHEDRIRRTDLAIMAYQQSVTVAAAEARRAVTRSRVAWGVAGGLTVVAFLAATWATHHVTKAQAEVSHLSASVRQLSDTVDVKSREIKDLTNNSQLAKVAAARAEGELAAARRQVDQLLDVQRETQARLSAHSTPPDASASGATTQAVASASPIATGIASTGGLAAGTLSATAATTQPVQGVTPATRPSATTHPGRP